MSSSTVAVQNASGKSRLLSWPQIVALLSLFVLVRSSRLLGDADTYWHLAAGRWIIDHGRVPTTDPFSHSMFGAPWTAHEWLAEVVIALVHQGGSWPALVLMTVLCWALALALLTRFLLARLEPIHALLFTALAIGMSIIHLLARPHAFVMPLLVFWVVKLVDCNERGAPPPWWLLALMVLWANLHGSFTLGLGLTAAIGFEAVLAAPRDARYALFRRWSIFLLLCVVASMLTPSGWRGLWFTFHVMRADVALTVIGEWQPPNFRGGNPLEVWILLMLGLAMAGRLRVPWVRMVVLLGLTHLALNYVRNVPILGLISPMLLAQPFAHSWYAAPSRGADAVRLDRWFRSLAGPSSRRGWIVTIAIFVVVSVATLRNYDVEPAQARTPEAALDAARKANVIERPVFNDYGFGGYLIYQGIPVYIDGRSDMYGDLFLTRTIEAMHAKDKFVELLDQFQIGWTLLIPGSAALAFLENLPGWRQIYADNVAVVHVRTAVSPPGSR
jgi:hypothetical protein